jgi:hypothetical protein
MNAPGIGVGVSVGDDVDAGSDVGGDAAQQHLPLM